MIEISVFQAASGEHVRGCDQESTSLSFTVNQMTEREIGRVPRELIFVLVQVIERFVAVIQFQLKFQPFRLPVENMYEVIKNQRV